MTSDVALTLVESGCCIGIVMNHDIAFILVCLFSLIGVAHDVALTLV